MKFQLSTILLTFLLICICAAWIADRRNLRLTNDRVTCELLLHHEKRSVRFSAIMTLRELGSLRSTDTLIYALSDPDRGIRHLAREALLELTGQSFSNLSDDDILPEEIEKWYWWAYQNGLVAQGDDADQELDELLFLAYKNKVSR